MAKPNWPGWELLGSFPRGEDGVGSWLLHHNGEAALLELPPGLTIGRIAMGLHYLGRPALKYIMASHNHEDHMDAGVRRTVKQQFPFARRFLLPSMTLHDWSRRQTITLSLGGEPLYLVRAPKHSWTDAVVVFRGCAMTGDIELAQLESVNNEVRESIRYASMCYLRGFQRRTGYHVHSIISAHLNDLRSNVCWEDLFRY